MSRLATVTSALAEAVESAADARDPGQLSTLAADVRAARLSATDPPSVVAEALVVEAAAHALHCAGPADRDIVLDLLDQASRTTARLWPAIRLSVHERALALGVAVLDDTGDPWANGLLTSWVDQLVDARRRQRELASEGISRLAVAEHVHRRRDHLGDERDVLLHLARQEARRARQHLAFAGEPALTARAAGVLADLDR